MISSNGMGDIFLQEVLYLEDEVFYVKRFTQVIISVIIPANVVEVQLGRTEKYGYRRCYCQ